ncbi:LytR/AlgR family response regulator transcription factor [Foetidibacter luteolus]|uniref:LytR/AlgR family response regulator transcription factor n=1 Tax=Foetidibacter luteolus TaxID=2608880 RepID=UPI00129B266D|nr:LytTR family DNA-binding domain-containing protein [Foetidibacter luteolus]
MIKALVIDDEPSAITTMQLLLERYVPEITSVKASNGADFDCVNALVAEYQPDILFLDIQMPVINGFELLRKLPAINFEVVFTTAHDQYAVQAIRFSALDYLLKPIDADELRATIERFIQKQQTQQDRKALYDNFLHNIQAQKKDFRLAVSTTEGTYFLQPDDIIRLEGEGNYTKFFFINRKPLLTSKTLKEYEEILSGHNFIRIHKSHMVNCQHVISYKNESGLIMKDNSVVEVSRRRKEEVMQALKNV